jgi:hypothetical protein
MKLAQHDKQKIMSYLPNFELSYEKLIHNKVHNYELCIAIPYGKKYLAWFTTYKNEFVCIFLEIDKISKKIFDIKIIPACFDKSLCSNTLLYGTMNCNKFFIIEDIIYYENENVSAYNLNTKLNLFYNLFENKIKQVSYIKNDVVFGLPPMNLKYDILINEIHNLPYKIYCIQFRTKNVKLNYLYKNESNKQAIFMIKPDIQNDIYNLYIDVDKIGLQFYDIACIPDFKTSVKMNKLFRNIKENKNLDALEESDDEDEFENINTDKYVHLNKNYTIKCRYSKKYNKWIPINITDASISNKSQIFFKK